MMVERRSTRKSKKRDFGVFVDSHEALRSVKERKELKATIIAQQRPVGYDKRKELFNA